MVEREGGVTDYVEQKSATVSMQTYVVAMGEMSTIG